MTRFKRMIALWRRHLPRRIVVQFKIFDEMCYFKIQVFETFHKCFHLETALYFAATLSTVGIFALILKIQNEFIFYALIYFFLFAKLASYETLCTKYAESKSLFASLFYIAKFELFFLPFRFRPALRSLRMFEFFISKALLKSTRSNYWSATKHIWWLFPLASPPPPSESHMWATNLA